MSFKKEFGHIETIESCSYDLVFGGTERCECIDAVGEVYKNQDCFDKNIGKCISDCIAFCCWKELEIGVMYKFCNKEYMCPSIIDWSSEEYSTW